MKVVRKKPGEAPEICEVENVLDAFPKGCEKYVCQFKFASECAILYLDFVCHTLRQNVLFAGRLFYGTILAVGMDGQKLCGLKPAVAETLMNWMEERKRG